MANSESEIFERALRIMQCVANNASEGHEFSKHWGEKFRAENTDHFIQNVKTNPDYDSEFWNCVFNLPEEQKQILGFLKWSKQEEGMCIPIWIWVCLPDDMSIGGNAEGKMKKDLDNDTRFGCVWWRV